MSTRVVAESHQFNDDYTWVPSTEDFDSLQKRLDALSRSVTNVSSSISAAERKIASQDKKIHEAEATVANAVEHIENVKSEIRSELTNGEWKTTLVDMVKNAIASFEKRVGEVNQTMAGQISDLVKHEVSARALVDELSHIKDVAVKAVEFASIEAKKKVDASVEGISNDLDGKILNLRELDAKLTSGSIQYDQLKTQSEETMSKILNMRKSWDATIKEIETLHERIRQRGEEIISKIDANSDGLSRLKKLDRRMTMQTILLVATVVLAIVCALIK